MKEALLQYLWEHKLWAAGSVECPADGRRIEVIDPGVLNTGSGPDFFNAKIRLDGDTLAGNVEIHQRASDWYRHGHDRDPAYDSVILHVVYNHDANVQRTDGSPIPTTRMAYGPRVAEAYERMATGGAGRLPCATHLAALPGIYLTDWTTSLAMERLCDKASRIRTLVDATGGDWAQAAFVALARGLGFSTNSEPMERLGRSISLRVLHRHADDPRLVEALLLGQAGLIPTEDEATAYDEATRAYCEGLRRDYSFLALKHGLSAPTALGWRIGRVRPSNLPLRRIASLAALVTDGFRLGREFAYITTIEAGRRLFDARIGGYWARHYTYGAPLAADSHTGLSQSSVDSLLINVLVPLVACFGQMHGDESRLDFAVELLQALEPEDNSLTRIFTTTGVPCDDAFTSQALIHLRRNYCEPRKCLYCRVGHRYLAATAREDAAAYGG